jgi:hypothetical protein
VTRQNGNEETSVPVMTTVRLLDGTKRDGTPVVVTIGRSITGRAVLMLSGKETRELDTKATLGLIIGASEVLLHTRPSEWGDQR